MKPQGWIGLFGVALGCAAIIWFGVLQGRLPQWRADAPSMPVASETPIPPTSPAPPASVSAPATPVPPPTLAMTESIPSFDIVRVEPDGSAVVAGRAPPGARVELLRDGAAHAEAVTNQDGQWAMVPSPLPKGSGQLSLRATLGGRQSLSRQVVTVQVPEKAADGVMVVLNAPDAPAKVLAQPAAPLPSDQAPPGAEVAAGPRRNARIMTVETDDAGRFFVSGSAQPGAQIRLYLNDALVASIEAAADGSFGLRIDKGVMAGRYQVRADDVDASGKVLTRAEVPFTKDVVAAPSAAPATGAQAGASVTVVPEVRTLTVARGDNLWRMSSKIYGDGTRYMVIYDANSAQIRNPNLIYPNQVLVLPADPPKP